MYLALMILSYSVPIMYVYYKYCNCSGDGSTVTSVSSIITSDDPVIQFSPSPALALTSRHILIGCMSLMTIFTLLYEYHRDYYAATDAATTTDAATDSVVCNKYLSILSIIVILIGIFGVITVPETNELLHYTFAGAVFFSIVAFMVVHCSECKSSLQFAEYYSNLRILLYIQLLFLTITVIGVVTSAPIFYIEVLFIVNFAVFYLYLHYITGPRGDDGNNVVCG
jgi:ABC-type multidrug transport system fused ATPase/permease subunit